MVPHIPQCSEIVASPSDAVYFSVEVQSAYSTAATGRVLSQLSMFSNENTEE